MIHPHTKVLFINEEIGFGVFATQFIPKGTITWCLDKFDRIFSQEEVDQMAPAYRALVDIFTFRNEKGQYILAWDNTKYVNHSSHSNCITTAYQYELAIRDIHPGEQLFNDYGYLNLPYEMDIIPEPDSDRTVVRPTDMLLYHKEWDAKLKDAYPHLPSVEQPLKDMMSPKLWQEALDIAAGKKEMDSILLSYYNPNK